MRYFISVWFMGAMLLYGFSLGTAEFCENQKPLSPMLALGWPVAAVAILLGDEIPPGSDVCILKEKE